MQSSFLFQSVQGGPFSNSSRMIDLDIPSNNFVDMSKSFIQLECSITPYAGLFPWGIPNLCVSNSATYATGTPMNIDLIKNCSLTSSTKGKREDIRRVNLLSHNLLEFTKSTSSKMSTLDSLYQVFNYDNNIKLSPFIEYKKVGSVASNFRSAFLRIPLSQLFQMGSMTDFDTNKLSTNRIHLELDNLSNLSVNQIALSSPLQQIAAPTPIVSGYSFTMNTVYDSLDMVPFYVGLQVYINFSEVLGAAAPVAQPQEDATINSLSFNEQTGLITVTTSFNFPVVVNTTYVSITMEEHMTTQPIGCGTFNILTAQLGLTVNNGPTSSINENELEYLTFTTEEYNNGGQPFMNKIFEIEPECVNTFLMINGENSTNMLSNDKNIQSYRLRIDGFDVVDRDINVNTLTAANTYLMDPLHYELVRRTFINASMPLSNITGVDIDATQTTLASRFIAPTNQILVICSPTPMTVNTKKYQVNLTSATAINNVVLFKHVVRNLKL
jgi:hypothetical protein